MGFFDSLIKETGRKMNRIERNLDRLEQDNGDRWTDDQWDRYEEARSNFERKKNQFEDFKRKRSQQDH